MSRPDANASPRASFDALQQRTEELTPAPLPMTPPSPERASHSWKLRKRNSVSERRASRSGPKIRRISTGRRRSFCDGVSGLYASTVMSEAATRSPTLGLRKLAEGLRNGSQDIMKVAAAAQQANAGSNRPSSQLVEPVEVARARQRAAIGLAKLPKKAGDASDEVLQDVSWCGHIKSKPMQRCRFHLKTPPTPFYIQRSAKEALAKARAGQANPSAAPSLARDYLTARSARELRRACQSLSLPNSGEKQQLIELLVEHYVKNASQTATLKFAGTAGTTDFPSCPQQAPEGKQLTDTIRPYGQLKPCMRLVVVTDFESKNNGSDMILRAGQLGTVLRIDDDGDTCVDFGTHGMHWVLSRDFDKLNICKGNALDSIAKVSRCSEAPVFPKPSGLEAQSVPVAPLLLEAGIPRRLRSKQPGMKQAGLVNSSVKSHVATKVLDPAICAVEEDALPDDRQLAEDPEPPYKRPRLSGKMSKKEVSNLAPHRLAAKGGA